jgi:phage-related protein
VRDQQWTIIMSTEVREWFDGLPATERAHAVRATFMLGEYGVLLREPHCRQLRGKLRELRFRIAGRSTRVTYFAWEQRTMVLLTIFSKSQTRQPREIDRAERAMIAWVEGDRR